MSLVDGPAAEREYDLWKTQRSQDLLDQLIPPTIQEKLRRAGVKNPERFVPGPIILEPKNSFMKTATTTGVHDYKWDWRFLELAKQVSTWSKDPSTKCGAVIVDGCNKVLGLGYNGFPAGCDDDPKLYADRKVKYQRVVHAEVNAILDAGDRARGARLYSYPSFAIPAICCECAKVAIQAGITEVIGYSVTNDRGGDWKESLDAAKQMLDEAGVVYRSVQPEVSTVAWIDGVPVVTGDKILIIGQPGREDRFITVGASANTNPETVTRSAPYGEPQ